MNRTLRITKLRLRGIRNLQPAGIEFGFGLNVLWGDNGQGKTSILEALVLAITGRSFRTDQVRDLVQYGQSLASADVEIADDGFGRLQRVDLINGRKQAFLDNKRTQRTANFASRTPVVVFHPADLELVSGPAALRRTLLARISLYINPLSFESHRAYGLAIRERQRLLMDGGPSSSGLDAFEQVASQHGVIVTATNAQAAEQLRLELEPVISQIAPAGLDVQLQHLANGTTDPNEFRQRLRDSRARDKIRGRAGFGPQRDDLVISLHGAEAKRHASQGQQRLLALAMKLAELASIRSVRRLHPILMLDDVSSELDPLRTNALFAWLRKSESQVFLTTTRLQHAEARLNLEIQPRYFHIQGGVAEQETAPDNSL